MAVGRSPAPAEVAEAFGLSPGADLLARRHLVRTGDAPVEVGASWFRPQDVTGTPIERTEVFDRPLYQEVEEATGRRYTTATDHLTARLPSRDEAEVLQIRPDTPVLVLLHVATAATLVAWAVGLAARIWRPIGDGETPEFGRAT